MDVVVDTHVQLLKPHYYKFNYYNTHVVIEAYTALFDCNLCLGEFNKGDTLYALNKIQREVA